MQNKIYFIFKLNIISFFPFSHFMQLEYLIWAHLNITRSEHYSVYFISRTIFQHFPILSQGRLSFFYHNLSDSSTVLFLHAPTFSPRQVLLSWFKKTPSSSSSLLLHFVGLLTFWISLQLKDWKHSTDTVLFWFFN